MTSSALTRWLQQGLARRMCPGTEAGDALRAAWGLCTFAGIVAALGRLDLDDAAAKASAPCPAPRR